MDDNRAEFEVEGALPNDYVAEWDHIVVQSQNAEHGKYGSSIQRLAQWAEHYTVLINSASADLEPWEPLKPAKRGPTRKRAKGEKGTQNDISVPKRVMTDGQKRLWDALHRKALTGKELAGQKVLDTSEDTVRHCVKGLRQAGYEIENRAGRGYYRPDAPPDDLDPGQGANAMT